MKVETGTRERAPRARLAPGLWAAGICALAALLAVASFRLGAVQAELQRRSGAATPVRAARAALEAPLRYAIALLGTPPPPRLELDIKFKHLQGLYEARAAKVAGRRLGESSHDFVPATIRDGSQRAPVKLRITGDDAGQLAGEKWPLLVHVKGKRTILGMRRFRLLAPRARGYQAEPLFLDHLRGEGVLAPRYLFVDVVLNGKDLGLMALEESFSTELLEDQQRRDGVMLRLEAPRPGSRLRELEVVAIRPNHIGKSRSLSRDLAVATERLRGFLDGSLDAGAVFDAELMGRFLAVVESRGATNALNAENLHFYFNPLTASLEPIGFAGSGGDDGLRPRAFARRLLEDPRVERAYAAALQRPAALAPASGAETVAEARWLEILHREYPMRVALHASASARRPGAARLAPRAGPRGSGDSAPSAPGRTAPVIPEESVEENLRRHPFLRWKGERREFAVVPGHWAVAGSIFLPEGAGLRVPAGVVLSFEPGAGLIARGPLSFEGSADAPVVLEGPAGERRRELWAGVYVMRSALPSRWTHVRVRNTGGFVHRDWRLSAGVVFRRTHAHLEDCHFTGSRVDDAVGMIRSTFTLEDVSVLESKGDALDFDYSVGRVDGGLIRDAGGDGIDLGGSRVTVTGTELRMLRDKAIVVGEESRLDASGLVIERADVGLASKNGSRAELRASELSHVPRVALLVYTNRSEFGPSRLVADGNRIRGVGRLALAERGNEIVIDGVPVESVGVSIASLEGLADSD